MKPAAKFVVQGLLMGVGFAVIAAGMLLMVWLGVWYWDAQSYDHQAWKVYSTEAQLVITESRLVVLDDTPTVLAKLENQGADAWSNISVEVELFDSEGRFIDECISQISDIVPSNTSENFKVVCSECKEIDPGSIARHDLRIRTARYQMPDQAVSETAAED